MPNDIILVVFSHGNCETIQMFLDYLFSEYFVFDSYTMTKALHKLYCKTPKEAIKIYFDFNDMFDDAALSTLIDAHYNVKQHKRHESFEIREGLFKYIEYNKLDIKPWLILRFITNPDQIALLRVVNMQHFRDINYSTWKINCVADRIVEVTTITMCSNTSLKNILDILDDYLSISNNHVFISKLWQNEMLLNYYLKNKANIFTPAYVSQLLEHFVASRDDIGRFKNLVSKLPILYLENVTLYKLAAISLKHGNKTLSAYLFRSTGFFKENNT
jgi:hypothetical protein